MRSRPLVRALKTIGWIGLIINLIFFLIIINFMFNIQEDGNLLTKLVVLIVLVVGRENGLIKIKMKNKL